MTGQNQKIEQTNFDLKLNYDEKEIVKKALTWMSLDPFDLDSREVDTLHNVLTKL